MNDSSKMKNPFFAMKLLIQSDEEFHPIEFAQHFSINEREAKIIWLSCPEFQEQFCRQHIHSIKARGSDGYGAKNWLRRRYKFSEDDLDRIFQDIWENPAEKVSTEFIKTMTMDRIAEIKLTSEAQKELAGLREKYLTNN